MKNDSIQNLLLRNEGLKKDFKSKTIGSEKLDNTSRKIREMCWDLMEESVKFNPEKLVEKITSYIQLENKMERILYSELNKYIYNLDDLERGIFTTNIENLLRFVLDDENNVDIDCRKIAEKIYDHFQLAIVQIENVNTIFNRSIETEKVSLRDEVKRVERDYISILGIFASIVLAFVGGMTFSTSVLSNIDKVSIFRLLAIVDLLGFVLINTVYILLKFIFQINDRDTNDFSICWVNILMIFFGILILLAWAYKVDGMRLM